MFRITEGCVKLASRKRPKTRRLYGAARKGPLLKTWKTRTSRSGLEYWRRRLRGASTRTLTVRREVANSCVPLLTSSKRLMEQWHTVHYKVSKIGLGKNLRWNGLQIESGLLHDQVDQVLVDSDVRVESRLL